MVVTRSQSKAQKVAKQHAGGDSDDDQVVLLGSSGVLGRGCRERRPTEFFTVEQPISARRTKPHVNSQSPQDDDDDDHTVIRRPQREAAKNALTRLRETLSNDVDDTAEPPTTVQRRKAARHVGSRRGHSSVDVSSESGSDDTDDSASTDASHGLIDQREASQLERMYARNKSKPINTFIGKLFGGKAKKGGKGETQESNHDRKRGRDEQDGGGDDAGEREGLGDITPLPVDPSITLESVGGLPNHVIALREMVIVPLLYPQLLNQFHITPPRGVLFVGPPGTGKTLMARALANEGVIGGQRRITFFVRKGADILSKWVGESEKQLRILFDEARRRAPSIIFFDELDGLAPVRHSKQEQSHACLVSTLLALMDGIDSRGQVIVIGATNRPDTIDPALRRPGRFDRELYFPLPDSAARRHIISIHTKEQLRGNPEKKQIEEDLLRSSEGWSGADIAAVCTEAALHALRSTVPQIFVCSHRLVLPPMAELHVGLSNFQAAIRRLQPALFRSAAAALTAPPLDEHLEVLCAEERSRLVELICRSFEPAASAAKDLERHCDDYSAAMRQLLSVPLPTARRALYCCPTSSSAQVAKMFSTAVAKAFPTFFCRTVHLPNLGVTEQQSSENPGHVETITSIVDSVRATSPSILLLLGIDEWMAAHAGEDGQQVISSVMYNLMLLEEHDVLVLCPVADKSPWLPLIQRSRRHPKTLCVKSIDPVPSADARKQFFRRLYDTCATCLDLSRATKTWPSLPVDTTPLPVAKPPRAERSAVWERLQYKRRQLRHILKKWMTQFVTQPRFNILLSADLDLREDTHGDLLKRWRKHTIGKRLGLQDIMEKLENEEYVSLSQYNDDIDLIVRNVRSFFATWSKEDQRYRARAAELKDTTVLNMYKINKNVVKYCEEHATLVDEPTSSDDDDAEETNDGGQPNMDVSPEVKQPRAADNLSTPSRRTSSAKDSSSSAQRVSGSSGCEPSLSKEPSDRRPGKKSSQPATQEVPPAVLADTARMSYDVLRNVMIDVLEKSRTAMRSATKSGGTDLWKIISTSVAEAATIK